MKETPSQLHLQSYVMNFPFSLSTSDPNNIWMQELSDEELQINRPKAYKQFMDLYNFMAGAIINIFITISKDNLSRSSLCSKFRNLQLPHIKDSNHILLSNFTSEPTHRERNYVGETILLTIDGLPNSHLSLQMGR
jgi:hypothetical protein